MIDLSVLICSTHTRWKTFGAAIQQQVWDQYDALPAEYRKRIEILMLTDNKQMMLGQKRNVMVDAAQGRYVQFIDDDDRIEPDMFRTLLDATDQDADVIAFDVSVSLNGEPPKVCRYSKDFEQDRNTAAGYERLPNHICCVKRDLASKVSFPNVLYGEDAGYSKLLRPHLKTEHRVDRVLYHYDFSNETTETQQHLRAAMRKRNQAPIVDVVMLSNAPSVDLQKMTQRAIDTCVAGANSLPVNVIVLEQRPGVEYRNSMTVHMPDAFNYNAFANHGARMGRASWIMVANNDLVFTDGWLHALLAANHPLVSPKCPGDGRQADIVENTRGDRTGRHFSGWCFMLRRALWNRIGGFDECVSFWCSDDVVVEQCLAVGVTPMLVADSTVEHLGSVTLGRTPDADDDLTWRQIDIFNRKYKPHRLSDHPKFVAWQKRQAAIA